MDLLKKDILLFLDDTILLQKNNSKLKNET